MRFIRYSLAATVVAAGVMLVPATASASTPVNVNCSTAYMTCGEQDTPGVGNFAIGFGLPSQLSTGQGTLCTQPYYSSNGLVSIAGSAFLASSPVPTDVRWRVWFGLQPNRASATFQAYKNTADSVPANPNKPPVLVSSDNGGAGYFIGCVVNYDEDAPPVDFSITIAQGEPPSS